MKKMINQETIVGRVYQHNLEIKTVQNKDSANYGKSFIAGTLDVATDEEGLNVIPIHFTYTTEVTSGGKKNVTYGVLESIINGGKTWIVDGKDEAMKVRVNTALGLNDFYTADGSLVSAKRNEGGFVNVIKDLTPENERNRFDLDMIITSIVEPDEGDYITLRGAVFDFRNSLLPVELICRDAGGIKYFNSLEASAAEPVFTEVKGAIVNSTINKEIEEESAFGTASVRTVTRTVREWRVDWARPIEYVFDADDTITKEELRKAMQDREVVLAGIKKRHDDYIASKSAAPAAAPQTAATTVPTGEFKF